MKQDHPHSILTSQIPLVGAPRSHFGLQCLARQKEITGNVIPDKNFIANNFLNGRVDTVLNGTVSMI